MGRREQPVGGRVHQAAGRVTLPVLPSWPSDPSRVPQIGPGSLVGRQGRYEVVELLGEGGMGRVYKAYDPPMDRYVALKLLKGDVLPEEQARFRREAQVAAEFSHLNLIPVLDRGEIEVESGGNPGSGEWMVMPYLRGQDIGEALGKHQRVRLSVIIDIGCQSLDAFEYIHRRHIVHCDVKPENLFITRDPYDRRIPVVKLIDFGIHRRLDPPSEPQSYLSGDPRYMAPEQAILNGPIDGRADLYGLGITLFEAATGRHPFDDLLEAELDDLLRAHAERPLPSATPWLSPSCPAAFGPAFDDFIQRACAKDREDRFVNALEMQAVLRRLGRLLAVEQAA